MTQVPEGMRECPTRSDGKEVLFAHAITAGKCEDRQRGHYHKCFACVHNGAAPVPASPVVEVATREVATAKAG